MSAMCQQLARCMGLMSLNQINQDPCLFGASILIVGYSCLLLEYNINSHLLSICCTQVVC